MNQPALQKIVTDLDALIRKSENVEDIEKQIRPVQKMIHRSFEIGKLQAARDILKGLMDH